MYIADQEVLSYEKGIATLADNTIVKISEYAYNQLSTEGPTDWDSFHTKKCELCAEAVWAELSKHSDDE